MFLFGEASPGRLFRAGLLLAGLCTALHAQPGVTPVNCVANVPVTPALRGEGFGERIGDITLTCTGGSVAALGTPLPMVNLTVFLNTAITSRLYSSSRSEVLLLVDEPGSGLAGTTNTQLVCNDAISGCPISATGTGKGSYDGSPGRPNIFQGQRRGGDAARVTVR